MATWDEVRRIANALPEVEQREDRHEWRVRSKLFALERPLRKSDHEALGRAAPQGPILGAYVPDLGVKEMLLSTSPEVYFTAPHFDGFPMVLARLGNLPADELHELLVEAWLSRAPKRTARAYVAERGLDGAG
ncbi:MmcQ/YjbR family DNA-binding protein [Pseudactinotalea sp. Z1748]|uniref:MmcQ/YjbR family DNA-binding protein n=1 Tax=Pseudactinotalea sp. Z1748 TaxID=3413027 RepID=UPI003C7B803B